MESNKNQEVWKRLTHWYRQASGGQAPPSREKMDSIHTKRAELYRCRPPDGIRIPILVMPETVEHRIPGEEEVEQAVRSIKRGRSGGLLGMRAEDLKELLREASREKDPVPHQ